MNTRTDLLERLYVLCSTGKYGGQEYLDVMKALAETP